MAQTYRWAVTRNDGDDWDIDETIATVGAWPTCVTNITGAGQVLSSMAPGFAVARSSPAPDSAEAAEARENLQNLEQL